MKYDCMSPAKCTERQSRFRNDIDPVAPITERLQARLARYKHDDLIITGRQRKRA
jgi:hypothetical protein